MMEDIQQASLEKLVADICLTEGVDNAKVTYSSNCEKYFNIVKIQIIGTNKKLHLVAKWVLTHLHIWKKVEARDSFVDEIEYYTKLIPLYGSLQERFGAKKSHVSVAKCYGSIDTNQSEMIILEDMIHKGYVLKNSLVPMDKHHLALVLEEYGKYHAILLAYKHHDSMGYKQLIRKNINLHKLVLSAQPLKILSDVCKNLNDILDPKEHGSMYEAFSEMLNELKGRHTIVTAKYTEFPISQMGLWYYNIKGKSWCNNMLFKYEDATKQPIDVQFLDVQNIGPGSAALDISYFLMANSSPEDIKNIDHYFKVYYDSLAENLRDLNCDPDSVYPYSIFQEQWKMLSVYGLIFAVTALKSAMAASEETPDSVEDVNFVGEHAEQYKRRIEAIITYYYETGII